MAERYKITNTTVKPPRIVNGKDERRAREKQGHFVQFYERDDDKSPLRLIGPGKFAVIGYLNEWFFEQEKKGEIKIEPIKDMGSALKEFRQGSEDAPEQAKKRVEPKQLNLKVNEMGKSPADENTLVNPDGEPNYVVKAPKGIGAGSVTV